MAGDAPLPDYDLADRIALTGPAQVKAISHPLRTTILGHVQRGGAPGAFDRLLATRLGAAAVDQLARDDTGVLVGLLKGEVNATSLAEVVTGHKGLDLRLFELARILAK